MSFLFVGPSVEVSALKKIYNLINFEYSSEALDQKVVNIENLLNTVLYWLYFSIRIQQLFSNRLCYNLTLFFFLKLLRKVMHKADPEFCKQYDESRSIIRQLESAGNHIITPAKNDIV